ncbi:MAG: hypothetical protein WD876_02470 [Candidatus Pacearchaeota archaeon]
MNFSIKDPALYLRLGLAFVFIYAAISAFLNPGAWIGYVPSFIWNPITRAYFLFAHDIVNLGLGLWLLTGKKQFYAAIVSCLALAGIIIFNLSSFLITFRDVGLLFAAIALAAMNYKKN